MRATGWAGRAAAAGRAAGAFAAKLCCAGAGRLEGADGGVVECTAGAGRLEEAEDGGVECVAGAGVGALCIVLSCTGADGAGELCIVLSCTGADGAGELWVVFSCTGAGELWVWLEAVLEDVCELLELLLCCCVVWFCTGRE